MSNLQAALEAAGSPMKLMSGSPQPVGTKSAYEAMYTTWQDEQKAWIDSAVIFDQSFHMTDLYIQGPDQKRLLSDTSVNSYANYGAGKAKQYLAVNENGYVIGDAIVFGLSDEESVVVGHDICANWLTYQAEIGDYDVKLVREDAGYVSPVPKRLYRYNFQGPNVWPILEKIAGEKLDLIKFFQIGRLQIAGHTVEALNHTMSGVPGQDVTGLELYGPFEERDAVLNALLEAGEEFGLQRGGTLAYASACTESGWLGLPLPAIYGDDLKAYREWLPAFSFANVVPLRGSLGSDNVEDYYNTPFDLGYGRMIKFDHDFIGREALEKIAENPPFAKVWFQWDDEDAARVVIEGSLGGDDRVRPLALPIDAIYYDKVQVNGEHVGIANIHGHSVNIGGVTSNGWIRPDLAVDGQKVEIVWGNADGGAGDAYVPNHKQTTVTATVHTNSPVLK